MINPISRAFSTAAVREWTPSLRYRLESRFRTVELETRGEELKQLQTMANDMTIKLEALDIDLQVPPRIRQVQSAAISPSNTTTASGALAE